MKRPLRLGPKDITARPHPIAGLDHRTRLLLTPRATKHAEAEDGRPAMGEGGGPNTHPAALLNPSGTCVRLAADDSYAHPGFWSRQNLNALPAVRVGVTQGLDLEMPKWQRMVHVTT
jgi:hypothetical protein